jgi:hypothetical protein
MDEIDHRDFNSLGCRSSEVLIRQIKQLQNQSARTQDDKQPIQGMSRVTDLGDSLTDEPFLDRAGCQPG